MSYPKKGSVRQISVLHRLLLALCFLAVESSRIQSFLLLKILESQGLLCKRKFTAVFLLGRLYSGQQSMHSSEGNATWRAEIYKYPSNYVAEGSDSTVPKTHLRLCFSGVRVACQGGSEGDLHSTLQAPKTHF